MPRIPTFTSTAKPTTDVGGIKSGIQISPSSTIAAKLLPSANELTNYAIKKRDNEEKLIAKKTVLELKAESDKIIQSQKDNISEDEAINNWKTNFYTFNKSKIIYYKK
jgi:Na+-translocating ferredoxin:NAD+ oxidoreductase RnfG subunit